MMKISRGFKDNNVVAGNVYDKYGSLNPVARFLMHGFECAMNELVGRVKPASIHEVGCGEGFWALQWMEQGICVKASDFSGKVIELAKANARARNLPEEPFRVCSIYDLNPQKDGADLIVCCEVLEHLERPEEGLQILQDAAGSYLVLSVPNEPLWRVLNMLRGKYWKEWGNTPGHVQHWSRKTFSRLVSQYFEVVEIRSPLPWTMLLCRNVKFREKSVS